MERINVRRGAAWMAVFFLVAFTACGGDDGTGPGGGGGGGGGGTTFVVTTSVSVGNGSASFSPANIQVSPGATVTFTWSAPVTHNVTFADASITDISNQSTGAFPVTMPTAPGDYTYQCTLHAGMNGTVRVQ